MNYLRYLPKWLTLMIWRAIPTCTLWRWDMGKLGYVFRPWPAVAVSHWDMIYIDLVYDR